MFASFEPCACLPQLNSYPLHPLCLSSSVSPTSSLSEQLPADLNKMHLTDHAHQQVMHMPPSQSGCSIASDSGSSSLSDIYQVGTSLFMAKVYCIYLQINPHIKWYIFPLNKYGFMDTNFHKADYFSLSFCQIPLLVPLIVQIHYKKSVLCKIGSSQSVKTTLVSQIT